MPRRKPKAAPQRAAAPARAPGPGTALIERGAAKGAVALTAEGLALVESVARDGGSQALVASRLGVALSTFKKVMERDESVRLAYERGHAELEHEVATLLLDAARKGAIVPAIYFSKARLGWRENDVVAPTQNGIQIVLSDSLTPDQWAERQRARAAALSAPSDAAPIDVEVKEITDVK